MKFFADLLPVLVFFIVYKTYDIYAATAVAIVASILMLIGQYLWYRKVETMTWVSALLIVVFGGATILLHSDIFIKIKPSILYTLFATAFLVMQMRGSLLVEKLMAPQLELELPRDVWLRLNNYWIGFFVFLTFLNLIVAYAFSTDTWVNFKLFGFTGLTLLFLVLQGVILSRAMNASQNSPGENASDETLPNQKEP